MAAHACRAHRFVPAVVAHRFGSGLREVPANNFDARWSFVVATNCQKQNDWQRRGRQNVPEFGEEHGSQRPLDQSEDLHPRGDAIHQSRGCGPNAETDEKMVISRSAG